MGPHAGVCAALERALATAGFQVVPPADAAEAGVFDSLRPVALVLQSTPGHGHGPGLAGPEPRADRPRARRPRGRPAPADGAAGVHPVELGVREFDALVVLLRNTPWVVTKQVLLETVWNYGGYDPNVVEVAICGLRRKLESHGPRVIQTVRGLGYAARATPSSPG